MYLYVVATRWGYPEKEVVHRFIGKSDLDHEDFIGILNKHGLDPEEHSIYSVELAAFVF